MTPSENVFYVYVLFRPWNGVPFYVGKGKTHRWLDHQRPSTKHRNKHFRHVVQKARRLGLDIPRVKIREGLSESDAFAIEKAFIAAIGRSLKGPLVNATDGGDGTHGFKQSAGTLAKRSAAMRGNKNALGAVRSEETRAKLRRPLSSEARAKISRARRGKPLSAEHRAKLSAAKQGTSLSAEHRKKIGLAHQGKRRSEEARLRMRDAMTRDKESGRWVGRINANKVNVDGIGELGRDADDLINL